MENPETIQNEKPLSCNHCNKTFKSLVGFNIHQRMHNGESPHQCEYCKKFFCTKSYLKVHLRLHTGEKPYKCDLCDKSFTVKSVLDEHRTIHTGRTFHCAICSHSFTSKNALDKHMTVHTGEKPYECDICKKKFRKRWSLTVHLRKHSGEKPYKCGICKSSFQQSSMLKIHERIHTGERPYQCDICDMKFIDKTRCNNHKKRLHLDDSSLKSNSQKDFSEHTGRIHVIHVKSAKPVIISLKRSANDKLGSEFAIDTNSVKVIKLGKDNSYEISNEYANINMDHNSVEKGNPKSAGCENECLTYNSDFHITSSINGDEKQQPLVKTEKVEEFKQCSNELTIRDADVGLSKSRNVSENRLKNYKQSFKSYGSEISVEELISESEKTLQSSQYIKSIITKEHLNKHLDCPLLNKGEHIFSTQLTIPNSLKSESEDNSPVPNTVEYQGLQSELCVNEMAQTGKEMLDSQLNCDNTDKARCNVLIKTEKEDGIHFPSVHKWTVIKSEIH